MTSKKQHKNRGKGSEKGSNLECRGNIVINFTVLLFLKSFPSNCSSETSSNARWNTRLLSSQWIKIISFVMNLSALKLFCEINWLSFDYMLLTNKFILYHVLNVLNVQFCLIFTLPSQIWAFIWGLPDFLGIGFKRLASASISFYLCFCAKNLVLSGPSLVCMFVTKDN